MIRERRFIFLFFLLSFPSPVHSQNETSAQEWISRAEITQVMKNGTWRGRLSHEVEGKSGYVKSFVLLVQDNRKHFTFRSKRRGNEEKILYLPDPLRVYSYNYLTGRKRQMSGADLLERVSGSAITYRDLYRVVRESDFSPLSIKKIKGPGNLEKLRIRARYQGEGILESVTLLLDPDKNGRTDRVDFFRRGNVLQRSMRFRYDTILLDGKGAIIENTVSPLKIQVMDLDNREISNLEFISFDDSVPIPGAQFDPEFLKR